MEAGTADEVLQQSNPEKKKKAGGIHSELSRKVKEIVDVRSVQTC